MAQSQHWLPDEVRALDPIEAPLNYLAPTAQRPVYYARSLAEGERRGLPPPEPHRVRIRDARRASEAPTLDRNGFQVVAHRSRVSSFADDALIRSEYYAEAIQVIRQATGAEHVVVFDHTLRSAEPSEREATTIRELLLKIFDSRTDGTARLTAHTAFDDPTSRPGAPPRRSIELRTLVFWDEVLS